MNAYTKLRLIVSLASGLVFPGLFIWAVNTLFGLGIPLTFKTWLASLVLFLTIRYFVNKSHYPVSYDDYGYDEDEEFEDYDDEEYDEDEDEDEDEDDDDEPTPVNSRNKRLRRVK